MNRVKRQVPASFGAARKDTLGEGCSSGIWNYFLGMERVMREKKKSFVCRDTRQLAGALSVSGNYKCEAKRWHSIWQFAAADEASAQKRRGFLPEENNATVRNVSRLLRRVSLLANNSKQ